MFFIGETARGREVANKNGEKTSVQWIDKLSRNGITLDATSFYTFFPHFFLFGQVEPILYTLSYQETVNFDRGSVF